MAPDDVIAPPYDVIDADDEAALLARSPYNAAHIECCPGEEHERYEAAGRRVRDWSAEGVLIRDDAPVYYLYEQRARIDGADRLRRCFFARLRLHRPEEGVVRPHESTMEGLRSQRLRLLRATQMNVSPIFAMFRDDGRARRALDAAARGEPAFGATDSLGEQHRLWVIADAALQAELTGALAASTVTIADGHHRYATALTYLDDLTSADPRLPAGAAARYVLTGLIPEDDPALVILSAHRLVRARSVPADLDARLTERFTVEPQDGWTVQAAEALGRRVRDAAGGIATFGWIDYERRRLALLRGRSREAIDEAMPSTLSAASRALDARILTETILRPLLGIDDAALADGQVGFTSDVGAAFRAGEGGEHRFAFLLNPTRVEQVSAVADAGELMPAKTTYFYPKLATGLVFNPLAD